MKWLAHFNASRASCGDVLAALPLVAWFGFCLAQVIPEIAAQASRDPPDPWSLLGSGASMVFCLLWMLLLLVRRRPSATLGGLLPRVIALGGTYLGVAILLQPAPPLPPGLALLSSGLTIAGTLLSIAALLHLGRSLSVVPQARRLVTSGPYRLIRHPLYLGEGLAVLGVSLLHAGPLAALLFAVQCACQARRMVYEETVLRAAFPEYAAYAAATPRLLPIGVALRWIRVAAGYFSSETPTEPLGVEQEKL